MRVRFLAVFLLSIVGVTAFGENFARADSSARGNVRILMQRRVNVHDDTLLQDLNKSSHSHWRRQRGAIGEVEVISADSADDSMAQQAIEKLRSRADVQFADIDHRRYAHAIPNDALFSGQWYLQSTQPAAIGADIAWDTTTGNSTVVIAILDTGVRFDHPDLLTVAQGGKLLPGYDFVSADAGGGFLAANDGNGWDADASDPGDWISASDLQKPLFAKCGGGDNQDQPEDSSWHGTRVAGMIGAASNNGIGIAGVAWSSLILPVRVLGKCGGYDSDILSAARWAAGLHVNGVPDNPNPAKIINMSFGSAGDTCSSAYQSVIQQLTALGVLIVVSAGNEGGPVDTPANCPGVVGVAGMRHVGTKVGFSSLGPEISMAAPAGNCFNLSGACLYSLTTTYDIGSTVPAGYGYTDQINTNLGTSFSAPLVAGVAALMRSVNSKLTTAQLRARLMEGTTAFPSNSAVADCHVPVDQDDKQQAECNCTNATCGAGMLNAPNAVIAAQRPIANIALPANFSAGSSVTLDASASTAADSRSVATYAWTSVDSCNSTPSSLTLTGADQSLLTVSAPSSGNFTLQLQVTDNMGAVDTAYFVINSTSVATVSAPPVCVTPPTPTTVPSAGHSGGGVFDWRLLVLLIALQIISAWKIKRLIAI